MKKDFIIRLANKKDIPAINSLTKEMHKLLGKLVGLRFSDKDLRDEEVKTSELKGILVAEHKGAGVVGYISFNPKPSFDEWYGKHIYLNEIAVKKGFRGEGIGKELMNRFISICKRKKVNIKVDTLIKNKKTIEFYEEMGFKPLMINFILKK